MAKANGSMAREPQSYLQQAVMASPVIQLMEMDYDIILLAFYLQYSLVVQDTENVLCCTHDVNPFYLNFYTYLYTMVGMYI